LWRGVRVIKPVLSLLSKPGWAERIPRKAEAGPVLLVLMWCAAETVVTVHDAHMKIGRRVPAAGILPLDATAKSTVAVCPET
jgi:hypothetical protein